MKVYLVREDEDEYANASIESIHATPEGAIAAVRAKCWQKRWKDCTAEHDDWIFAMRSGSRLDGEVVWVEEHEVCSS